MIFEYLIDGKRKEIDVKVCKSFFSKCFGLMFKARSKPLLFVFKKERKIAIHSFFCVPFRAIWLDKSKSATRILEVPSWKPYVEGVGKFLLEIP